MIDPRDQMQAEHDARLSEHSAFQAPAAMPSEEEIAHLVDPDSVDAGGIDGRVPMSPEMLRRRGIAVFKARAILALFAPILAEKERRDAAEAKRAEFEAWLEDLAENPPPPNDALKKLFADYHAAAIKSLVSEADWEARSLAAEAALAKAVVFDLGQNTTVESRGDGAWAVKNGGSVLNVDGVWEWEPSPSNRTDEFIARTRFDREDAFRRAAAIRAEGE